MILTLENSSDSFTEWVDASGQTVSIWAEPNSLIVVKAGAALHQVTRIKKGTNVEPPRIDPLPRNGSAYRSISCYSI
jgi:diaminopimelate decarboxylase